MLLSVLQDDVSGDYKEILLAMIGERPPPAPVPEEEDAGEPELEEVEEEQIEVWVYLVYFPHSFEVRLKSQRSKYLFHTALFDVISAIVIFARDSIYAKARICYRNSVRLSVCPSVTRVIHAKTVEVRILQFSPYSSPIPLVFAR